MGINGGIPFAVRFLGIVWGCSFVSGCTIWRTSILLEPGCFILQMCLTLSRCSGVPKLGIVAPQTGWISLSLTTFHQVCWANHQFCCFHHLVSFYIKFYPCFQLIFSLDLEDGLVYQVIPWYLDLVCCIAASHRLGGACLDGAERFGGRSVGWPSNVLNFRP